MIIKHNLSGVTVTLKLVMGSDDLHKMFPPNFANVVSNNDVNSCIALVQAKR